MDTPDPGESAYVPSEEEAAVPAAEREPVGTGAGVNSVPPPGTSSATTSSAGPGIGDRYGSATSRIESSSAVTSARGYLGPLEQFGRQNVAYVAAALVLIGTFLPEKYYSVSAGAYSVSATRSIWDLSVLWGIVLVLAALATAFAAWQHDYRLLWATGGVILVAEILNLLNSFSGELGTSARPTWGWIILIVGLLGILAAAIMPSKPGEPAGDAVGYVQSMINSNRS
jgi:hypothetical protein